MTFQEVFVLNLKNMRKSRKISQLKLAELCESSQRYIAEIEVGKKFPSPGMVEKIASALGIESYCLFQNEAGDRRTIPPSQRQELVLKLYDAIFKTVSQFD